MLNWIFGRRHLDAVLNEVKAVKIKGVSFHIKKICPLDVAAGYNVMLQAFNTYDADRALGKATADPKHIEKIKEHYADVFMSAVVSPKITNKKDEPGKTFVGNILNDWDICEELYTHIIEYTYGKKKFKQLESLRSRL